MCAFGKSGDSYFVSYRDPNLKSTVEAYEKAADFIEDVYKRQVERGSFLISFMTYNFKFRLGRKSLERERLLWRREFLRGLL